MGVDKAAEGGIYPVYMPTEVNADHAQRSRATPKWTGEMAAKVDTSYPAQYLAHPNRLRIR
jgi:hypothetical protein